MTEVVQLTSADEKSLGEINILLRQMSPRVPECSQEVLERVFKSADAELWVAQEGGGAIVGMGELVVIHRPEGSVGRIEDVVVLEAYRGQGIGKKIMEKLIERARERELPSINLSSRPSREAANALYQKLGFKIHETNSYYLNL